MLPPTYVGSPVNGCLMDLAKTGAYGLLLSQAIGSPNRQKRRMPFGSSRSFAATPLIPATVLPDVLILPTAKAGGFLLRRGSRYAQGPCPLHRR